MKHNFEHLTVIDHPLITDRVTQLRERTTTHGRFKTLIDEVSPFLFYEASREMTTRMAPINTPLEAMDGLRLGGNLLLAPILRAGLAMVTGITPYLPDAVVGMIGIYRDHDTLQPVDYYLRLPEDLSGMQIFLLDPMLATGGSAVDAVNKLKAHGAEQITMIALICAPEGVEKLAAAHPDVHVYTAALDRQLNDIGYILPGLGDAGDRYFGV